MVGLEESMPRQKAQNSTLLVVMKEEEAAEEEERKEEEVLEGSTVQEFVLLSCL